MGCASSKPQFTPRRPPSLDRPSSPNRKEPLSVSERESRIEHSKEDIKLIIQGVEMTYAWVSLRGYYPEALNKDNQGN